MDQSGHRPAGRALAALLGLLLLPLGATRAAADWSLCDQAIQAAEPASGLPEGLLAAISRVETGRLNPASGRVDPWPWSYNVEGKGFAAATKAQAVAAVAAHLAAGQRSIDVGCMQINLKHHPQGFASLEEAFEPRANTAYAIRFLRELRATHGEWPIAVSRYHSGEPERGEAYRQRVERAALRPVLAPPSRPALRTAAMPGLPAGTPEQLARAELAELRLLIAHDPARALTALSDAARYRNLPQEQRAGMTAMARLQAELQAVRARARRGA